MENGRQTIRVHLHEDLSISKFVIGCMRMNHWDLSIEQRIEFVEWCLEQGLTTFDHADIYGKNHNNESLFGKVLQMKPDIRDKVEIVTKCSICVPNDENPIVKTRFFNTDREYILKQVDQSLEKLQCGYIDLLLIHMHDLLVNPQELNGTLNHLKTQGKVRYFGLSNHNPLEFDTLQKYSDERFVAHQFMLHPLGIENYKNGTMTHSLKDGIHPMIWSPLAGGRIFNPSNEFEEKMKRVLEEIRQELDLEDIDQVVYKWILKHSSEPAIVLGTGNKERIWRAIQSISGAELTREQWYKILVEAGYKLW